MHGFDGAEDYYARSSSLGFLHRIRVPTLLIVGELDTKFTRIAWAMAKRLRDARVVVAPGAGHAVHLERPDVWLEAVLGFLC